MKCFKVLLLCGVWLLLAAHKGNCSCGGIGEEPDAIVAQSEPITK